MKMMQTLYRSVGTLAIWLLPLTAIAYGHDASAALAPAANAPTASIAVVVRVFDRVAKFQLARDEFDSTLKLYSDKKQECAQLPAGERLTACTAQLSALLARAQALLDDMTAVVQQIEAEVGGSVNTLTAQDSARIDRILAEVRSNRDSRERALRSQRSVA